MADTNIDWATWSWNFLRGCSRYSRGCGDNQGGGCYAERDAWRFAGEGLAYEGLVRMTANGPRWTGDVRLIPEKLDDPLTWRKPRRVFVNSTSDLFHKAVPDAVIDEGFARMALAVGHRFLTLTKRADRQREYFDDPRTPSRVAAIVRDIVGRRGWPEVGRSRFEAQGVVNWLLQTWPLQNLWSGVSVEDQESADRQIPLLLGTFVRNRWVSLEPMLEPVDLAPFFPPFASPMPPGGYADRSSTIGARLEWVVIGGESGPGARVFDPEWLRKPIRQCAVARVPIFVKQLGANVASAELLVNLKSKKKKRNDPNEWPAELQVREYPAAMKVEEVSAA